MTAKGKFDAAMKLFFDQHASLHARQVNFRIPQGSSAEIWSFEDALLDNLREAQFRRIPNNREHSIAWCIWHLARIEDTAMNILVADSDQVFNQDDWHDQLGVSFRDCGNEMSEEEIMKLSVEVNLKALRDYRLAVGCRTREIVSHLQPEDLKVKVDLMRIQRVLDEGAITEAARGITDYWSKRDIAGLLLMPATRHNLVHLGEVLALKTRKN
jgi:hypothetical protein